MNAALRCGQALVCLGIGGVAATILVCWATEASSPPALIAAVGVVGVVAGFAPSLGLLLVASLGPLSTAIAILLGAPSDVYTLIEAWSLVFIGAWAIRELVRLLRSPSAWPTIVWLLWAWSAWVIAVGVLHASSAGAAWGGDDFFGRAFFVSPRFGDPLRASIAMAAGPWLAMAVTRTVVSRAQAVQLAWAFSLGAAGAAALNLNRLVEAALRSEQPVARLAELLATQRVNALFIDFNAAGSWFAMALVMAFGAAVWDRRYRLTGAVAIVFTAGGVVLSGSRAAVLALAVVGGVAFIAPLLRRRRVVASALVLVLLAAVVGGVAVRRQTASTENMQAVEFRVEMLIAGWRMVAAHPVFGVGPDGFHGASATYMDPDIRRRFYQNENAHNNFVQIFAETGIIGGVLFLLVVGYVVRQTLVLGKTDRRLSVFGAATVVFLITALLGHPLLIPTVAAGFWLCVGIASSLRPHEQMSPPNQPVIPTPVQLA